MTKPLTSAQKARYAKHMKTKGHSTKSIREVVTKRPQDVRRVLRYLDKKPTPTKKTKQNVPITKTVTKKPHTKKQSVKPTPTKKTPAPFVLLRGANKYKIPVLFRCGITVRESVLLKNTAFERKYTQPQFEKMVEAYDQHKLRGGKSA